MFTAVFESFDPQRFGWSLCLRDPLSIRVAHRLDEVMEVLGSAEEGASKGLWAAILASYDAAPTFDPALAAHSTSGFPLAWVALFSQPVVLPLQEASQTGHSSEWKPLLSKSDYVAQVRQAQEYIAQGESYQVNFTFPLRSRFSGDSWNWYRQTGKAQGAGYSAYLDLGRYRVLCFSPELFLERRGDRLVTRPMKGTVARGRWHEEDEARHRELKTSAKNQAENVMIVDLLRNDLGRVSIPGSVQVTRLFEVEKYPTLYQMTSTVESRCNPSTSFVELMKAFFPCGSVTGAPKIRTTQIIRELESFPRELYTGTIGFLKPGGDFILNVAIRTVVLDMQTDIASFGTGGGITSDSDPEEEYQECLLKAQFLTTNQPEFDLLETLLLDQGEYFLLARHLRRMVESASYFGFAWPLKEVRSALEGIRCCYARSRWKVRLTTSKDGKLTTEVFPLLDGHSSIKKVCLARGPVDSSNPFFYHKTTWRSVYNQMLQSCPGWDDVILWNEKGEITESCVANVVIETGGHKWTPPVSCGLLQGTLRNELLERGEIQERIISKEELRQAESVYLINSVQKWTQIRLETFSEIGQT